MRVFGHANVARPPEVKKITVKRNLNDTRKAIIEWEASAGATGYTIRFGVSPEKLYGSYQVDKKTWLVMNWLNRGVGYYFAIDAHNENGVTTGRNIVESRK